MLILAIESSCDENSVAVLRDGALLSVCTRTQTVHQQFGGVVPELAGRSHLELIDPLTREAVQTAGVALADLDFVVSTVGPGLVGSLLVGASYGRGLALALGKPFRAMHHVEAHLWSAELTAGKLPLPFLVLLVSGGHTLLIHVDGLRHYHVLGTTLDDALGEAYDKVGKLVGLKFPAGAEVDRLAAEGNPAAFRLPIGAPRRSVQFQFLRIEDSRAVPVARNRCGAGSAGAAGSAGLVSGSGAGIGDAEGASCHRCHRAARVGRRRRCGRELRATFQAARVWQKHPASRRTSRTCSSAATTRP